MAAHFTLAHSDYQLEFRWFYRASCKDWSTVHFVPRRRNFRRGRQCAKQRPTRRSRAAVSRKGGGGKGGPPHRPPRSQSVKCNPSELSGLNGEIEYRTPEKKVNVKSTNMVKERRGPWKVPFEGVCEAVELGAFPRRRWADEPFYLFFFTNLGIEFFRDPYRKRNLLSLRTLPYPKLLSKILYIILNDFVILPLVSAIHW